MAEYTLEVKYDLIKQEIVKNDSKNPITIIKDMMKKPFIGIHGSEHHFLDGAAFLTAFKNAGGEINLAQCLDELLKRTIKMPGAMCGHWGVCGSVTSIGAAFSIIHGTSPLSTDEYYKDNIRFTSAALKEMSEIGGARCCKRNAFLSLSLAAEFAKEKYGAEMESDKIQCDFSPLNNQCLKESCPFYKPCV